MKSVAFGEGLPVGGSPRKGPAGIVWRANRLTGVDTAFGPDSLTAAKTSFPKQKAGPDTKPKDQKPVNIRPEYLVVPVELETEAELLTGSAQLMNS